MGLPADGLKPQLVERLLSFQRHQESDKDHTAQRGNSSGPAENQLDSDWGGQAAGGQFTTAGTPSSGPAAALEPEHRDVASPAGQATASAVGIAGVHAIKRPCMSRAQRS